MLVVVRIFDLLLCYQYFTAQYTILHSDAVLRQILLGFSTGKSPRRNSSTPACIPSGTSGRRRNLLYIMWSLEPLLVTIKTPPRNSKKKKRHPKTKAQSHYTCNGAQHKRREKQTKKNVKNTCSSFHKRAVLPSAREMLGKVYRLV